jgi:hypothetical protein
MNLSSYMFNLFMTVIILLFMLIGYLYYQITYTFKENFENLELNGIIDISGIDINNINIQEKLQQLHTMDLSGSTAYGRDLLTKTESQCELFQKQKEEFELRIEEYRSKGYFDNLRITYEMIENIKENMKNYGCA